MQRIVRYPESFQARVMEEYPEISDFLKNQMKIGVVISENLECTNLIAIEQVAALMESGKLDQLRADIEKINRRYKLYRECVQLENNTLVPV